MPTFQTIYQGSAKVDRSKHVWKEVFAADGAKSYKCVLCGGVTDRPDDECVPARYERLTDKERKLCLPSR